MEREFKILLFPWLAHGHVSPYFELATRLSKKNFKTYLLSTPIHFTMFQNPSDSPVELIPLHLPASSELPPDMHTTRNASSHQLALLFYALQSSESIFSEILTSLKPDLLIYDIMQLWSAKLALSMDIPCVHFGMGAACLSYYHHIHTHGSSATYPFPAINLYDDETFDPRVINKFINGLENEFYAGVLKLSTDIVLLKSYAGFEAKYIDHLSDLCKRKVLPTGHLMAESRYADDKENFAEIMNWLDEKPQFSTLYISFGSECYLSKEQMHHLAEGLELSGANFIWVIKFSLSEKDTALEEVLPEGFLERTEDRGMMITKWAPQQAILAHPSLAAFISHCGWSSIAESLYFAVPIIAMPMKLADWPVNAAVLVESGAGVKIERKPQEIYKGEAIAKSIKEVVRDENVFRKLKNRAVELSTKMKEDEELEVNGVAEELRKLCMKKNRLSEDLYEN